MKTKTVDEFTYTGLGFPIILFKVQMVNLDNEWHPKINVKKVAYIGIIKLAEKTDRLTGAQVKFIRHYFSMPLREFGAKVAHVSHQAVKKWEAFGEEVTNMDKNIEIMIKLFIMEALLVNNASQKKQFFDAYLKIKQIYISNESLLLSISYSEYESFEVDPNQDKRNSELKLGKQQLFKKITVKKTVRGGRASRKLPGQRKGIKLKDAM